VAVKFFPLQTYLNIYVVQYKYTYVYEKFHFLGNTFTARKIKTQVAGLLQ